MLHIEESDPSETVRKKVESGLQSLVGNQENVSPYVGGLYSLSYPEAKNIGLLVTGADAFEDNAEGMFSAFDRIVDFLLAIKSGELYVGECSVPSELSEEVKDKALELARTLVD